MSELPRLVGAAERGPAAVIEAPRPLLRLTGIGVRFGRKQVLRDIDLTVRAGEIVTLIGPNGSGKSTLVRAALGQVKLWSGNIWRAPKLRLAYVPQDFRVDATMSITVRRLLSLAGRYDRDKITAALGTTGTAHLLESPVQGLSGGETKRVLLARALLREPDLLVLDEPAAAVDAKGQESFYRLIQEIRDNRGCGVLLVSHDLHLVMAATDQVMCINGHVCCHGTPADVARNPVAIALFGRELVPYQHSHDHEHDTPHDGPAKR